VGHLTTYGKRRSAALFLATGLLLYGAGPITGIGEAGAQTSAEAISLDVPSALQLTPDTPISLPIQLKPAAAVPRRAIVLIRGLPSTVTLSEGRLFESGVWGVPVTDINKARISSVSVSAGRIDVTISLVTIDGTLLAEARSSLVVETDAQARSGTDDRTMFTAAPPQDLPSPAPLAPSRLTPQQSEQLFLLVKKGDDQMAVGNVSAARLLYQHAAESGLAVAAMALAASYDEEELRKRRVMGGVQPDQKQAQFWYEKARQLGSAEAHERLQRFGAR
jgi:hypothetical protein